MADSRFNGKTGEALRILLTVGGAVLASYFATSMQTEQRVTKVETLEQSHFEETQRTLKMMDDNTQRTLSRIERFMERIEATGADRDTGEPYSLQRRYQR